MHIGKGKPQRAAALQSDTGWAPTPEFRRHHDVQQPDIGRRVRREAWTITSRFRSLEPDEAMCDAADRFYRDCAVASGARQPAPLERVDEGKTDGISDAQVNARHRLRLISQILDPDVVMLLFWLIVEDWSFSALAPKLGCDRHTAKDRLRILTRALVEAYRVLDQQRKRTGR